MKEMKNMMKVCSSSIDFVKVEIALETSGSSIPTRILELRFKENS